MATPLLTRARQDAGWSKAELARRANTSRTTVSAYEHGSKTPTLTTLERLVGVAGFELVLQPRPTRSPENTEARRCSSLTGYRH